MEPSPPASLAAGRTAAYSFHPSESSSIPTTPSFASANDYFGAAASRKRQRPDSSHCADRPLAFSQTPGWNQWPTPSDGIYNSAYGQQSSFVNERYRLGDGFDTPLPQSTARLEQLTVNEHEFRRRLRDDDTTMGNFLRTDRPPFSGPVARERIHLARMPSSEDAVPQTSWTSFAFGLVGKVFSFGSSVVRGFYAGGGQGYDLQNYPLVGSDLLQQSAHRTSTPLPGSWQEDEFLGDFEQDSPTFTQQSSANRPPNKRRQTDRDAWVMVGTPEMELMPGSPKRKVSGNSVPRLATRPQASRASSRKSLAPVSRRTSSYTAANASPVQFGQPLQSIQPSAQPSYTNTPQQPTHNRRASVASTRSPHGHSRQSSANGTTWMSPEAERYNKRQAKQDKAISSMGKRMEEMIRQAQQALGTKFTVEGDADMEDEGFVDDDW